MDRAGLGRLRAREEALAEDLRARRGRELAGLFVDVDEDDAVRDVEGARGLAGRSAGHERRPDRERGLRAAEADRLVVVEADPHDREEVRREADEPGITQVVGRAGLARGVEREALAARPGAGAL